MGSYPFFVRMYKPRSRISLRKFNEMVDDYVRENPPRASSRELKDNPASISKRRRQRRWVISRQLREALEIRGVEIEKGIYKGKIQDMAQRFRDGW